MDNTFVPLAAIVVLLVLLVFSILKAKRLEGVVAVQKQELSTANQEVVRIRHESEATVVETQKLIDLQRADIAKESERVRQHFEAEALKLKSVFKRPTRLVYRVF